MQDVESILTIVIKIRWLMRLATLLFCKLKWRPDPISMDLLEYWKVISYQVLLTFVIWLETIPKHHRWKLQVEIMLTKLVMEMHTLVSRACVGKSQTFPYNDQNNRPEASHQLHPKKAFKGKLKIKFRAPRCRTW